MQSHKSMVFEAFIVFWCLARRLILPQCVQTGIIQWRQSNNRCSFFGTPCSNADYEQIMQGVCERAQAERIDAVAFGDLFLEDVRAYRERQMQSTGLELLFPAWGIPTEALAREMIASGVKAKITCVDPSKLPAPFAARDFNTAFLADLPPGIDPCGENGEFHSFVYAAPIFTSPIEVTTGEIVHRDGFVFADVLPNNH